MQKATKAKISLGHFVINFFPILFARILKHIMKHKIRDPGPVWQLISAFIFVYADLFLCAFNGVNFKVWHKVNYAANILKY